MQNNTSSEKAQNSHTEPQIDPAELWWRVAAGEGRAQPAAAMPQMAEAEQPWRWRYSWLCGIMYGPIPVGFIIALPLLLVLYAR